MTEVSYLMKILPVGAELIHADRQTEMTRLTVAFRTFKSGPNKNRECLAGGKTFASAWDKTVNRFSKLVVQL